MTASPQRPAPSRTDAALFAPAQHETLRTAVADLGWLLGRSYAPRAALKLVGDRHQLHERQRLAVLRSSCAAQQRADRRRRQVPVSNLEGSTVLVDGHNVLITLEVALAEGLLLLGLDGCLRDLAGIQRSLKCVEQTRLAVTLLGEALESWGVAHCVVYLDRPVSNSGRLAQLMRDMAKARAWSWTIEPVMNPDSALRQSPQVVATADSAVLDSGGPWINLAREIVSRSLPGSRWIDFACDGSEPTADPARGAGSQTQ